MIGLARAQGQINAAQRMHAAEPLVDATQFKKRMVQKIALGHGEMRLLIGKTGGAARRTPAR